MAVLAIGFATSAVAQQEGRPLSIVGEVESPLVLSIDELEKLPAVDVDDARTHGKGAPAKGSRHYVGVLLSDLLNRAKLVEREPHDPRRSIVIATARARIAEGYEPGSASCEMAAADRSAKGPGLTPGAARETEMS